MDESKGKQPGSLMREKGGVEKNEKWKLEMKLEKLKKEKKTMKKVLHESKKNKGKKYKQNQKQINVWTKEKQREKKRTCAHQWFRH